MEINFVMNAPLAGMAKTAPSFYKQIIEHQVLLDWGTLSHLMEPCIVSLEMVNIIFLFPSTVPWKCRLACCHVTLQALASMP